MNDAMEPFVFKGTELFAAYVQKQLAPSLEKDDVVLLDNSSVHHAKLVIETLNYTDTDTHPFFYFRFYINIPSLLL